MEADENARLAFEVESEPAEQVPSELKKARVPSSVAQLKEEKGVLAMPS